MNLEEREPAPIAHAAIHETVARILENEERGSLLDVPAGEGALALRLQNLGFDVSCCDLYPQIFKYKDAEIKAGNLDGALPYADDSFDYAVCVEGLEHIENPANAVREMARVVRAGGQVVVSVPNILNIEERLKWLVHGYTSHFKPLSQTAIDEVRREYGSLEEIALHVNPIGYSELRYLLEKNNFAVRKIFRDKAKANSWAFLPLTALIRLIGRLNSARKRRERWTDELNSDAVLLGGNTLIIHAQLEK